MYSMNLVNIFTEYVNIYMREAGDEFISSQMKNLRD